MRTEPTVLRGTPESCADVTYDMRDEHASSAWWEADVGDLLWNPKGGDGHVLVAEVPCDEGRTADCGCGGWLSKRCTATTLVCECGEDSSWRDHHYELLAKAAGLTLVRGSSELERQRKLNEKRT